MKTVPISGSPSPQATNPPGPFPGGEQLWKATLEKASQKLDGTNFPKHAFTDFRELIRYQGIVHQVHLRVELVSRIADAALHSVRKFQQQQ